METLLLTVIAALLAVIAPPVVYMAGKVWNHEQRLCRIENGQEYCPHHFKAEGTI